MNEKYYVVYLTSGSTVRVRANGCYICSGDYVFTMDDKVVARFFCAKVEGWVQEDG